MASQRSHGSRVIVVAAALMLYVSGWLILRQDPRAWKGFLREGGRGACEAQWHRRCGTRLSAVFREGAESVLFIHTLATTSGGLSMELIGGLMAAAVCLAILFFVINNVARRLPLRPSSSPPRHSYFSWPSSSSAWQCRNCRSSSWYPTPICVARLAGQHRLQSDRRGDRGADGGDGDHACGLYLRHVRPARPRERRRFGLQPGLTSMMKTCASGCGLWRIGAGASATGISCSAATGGVLSENYFRTYR